MRLTILAHPFLRFLRRVKCAGALHAHLSATNCAAAGAIILPGDHEMSRARAVFHPGSNFKPHCAGFRFRILDSGVRIFHLASLCLCVSAATFNSSADNYAAWSSSRTLYLNTNPTTGANVAGDIVNFPVLVRLTSSNWPTGAKSDGTDIRFSKNDGTHLYYERERWDNENHLAEFWVLVDTCLLYTSPSPRDS